MPYILVTINKLLFPFYHKCCFSVNNPLLKQLYFLNPNFQCPLPTKLSTFEFFQYFLVSSGKPKMFCFVLIFEGFFWEPTFFENLQNSGFSDNRTWRDTAFYSLGLSFFRSWTCQTYGCRRRPGMCPPAWFPGRRASAQGLSCLASRSLSCTDTQTRPPGSGDWSETRPRPASAAATRWPGCCLQTGTAWSPCPRMCGPIWQYGLWHPELCSWYTWCTYNLESS